MTDQTITDVLYLIDAWERGAYAEEYQTEIASLRQALEQPEQENISRCKQCGGALPVTGAFNRTGECDCIGQLKVISTIAWFNAPVKTEWGEDMMCADISIDKDHTLTLYCELSQIHKVPTILKGLL